MDTSKIHPEALGTTCWLTTEVHLDGHPDTNIKDEYPGVVGLSLWDMKNNRYEFFDTETGESKLGRGGAGYFFITGDKRRHVIIPDNGNGPVVRNLERLDPTGFTYTRVVPEKMLEGNPPVKIWVIHKPYHGPLNCSFTQAN